MLTWGLRVEPPDKSSTENNTDRLLCSIEHFKKIIQIILTHDCIISDLTVRYCIVVCLMNLEVVTDGASQDASQDALVRGSVLAMKIRLLFLSIFKFFCDLIQFSDLNHNSNNNDCKISKWWLLTFSQTGFESNNIAVYLANEKEI